MAAEQTISTWCSQQAPASGSFLLCQNKKKVYLVESYKDLIALGRKYFVGQRVRSVFWWLLEGSELEVHQWAGVGTSPGLGRHRAPAACMGWAGAPRAGTAQHCHSPHCSRDQGDTTGRCCCQSTRGLDDTIAIMMILMIIITNYQQMRKTNPPGILQVPTRNYFVSPDQNQCTTSFQGSPWHGQYAANPPLHDDPATLQKMPWGHSEARVFLASKVLLSFSKSLKLLIVEGRILLLIYQFHFKNLGFSWVFSFPRTPDWILTLFTWKTLLFHSISISFQVLTQNQQRALFPLKQN